MTKPIYKDGKGEPIDHFPTPRKISNTLGALKGDVPKSKVGATALLTFWGQFMDHDFTAIAEPEKGEPTEHMDIPIPKGDAHFDPEGKGNQKIEFKRSKHHEVNQVRTFANEITSFIDAGTVYGSDDEKAKELRSFKDGKMLVSEGNYLPKDEKGFFKAGDFRANENMALTSMHTLWVREHNRKCDEIKKEDPSLNDE